MFGSFCKMTQQSYNFKISDIVLPIKGLTNYIERNFNYLKNEPDDLSINKKTLLRLWPLALYHTILASMIISSEFRNQIINSLEKIIK